MKVKVKKEIEIKNSDVFLFRGGFLGVIIDGEVVGLRVNDLNGLFSPLINLMTFKGIKHNKLKEYDVVKIYRNKNNNIIESLLSLSKISNYFETSKRFYVIYEEID